MAAGKLFGLKTKEPNWNLSKEEDYLQMTVNLEGVKDAEKIVVDVVDGTDFELVVDGLYSVTCSAHGSLKMTLPCKVKDEEKDGVICIYSKKKWELTIKMPFAAEEDVGGMMGGMDPEEAMMMGMDPEEAMMMGEMGMGGAAPAKKRGRRRLSIDNAPVNRSLEEIVAYFMMRREDAGKQRCEHVEKHLQIPAGFIDIKLKKMFKECRCKSKAHLWTCLTCYEVHCAGCGDTRTVHYKAKGHGLSMNCKCEAWCWECAGDPLDERITPIFSRIYALKHGKKPADVLEALEQAKGTDLKTSVAHILNTQGELESTFADYDKRMSGMMQHFDHLVTDLSKVWGNFDEWEGED